MSKKDVKYTVRPSCEKEHHGITVKAAICISDTSDTEKEWKCIADHSASAKDGDACSSIGKQRVMDTLS